MPSYRLPPDLQADLTWLWTQADADLGVCSGGDIQHRGPADFEAVRGENGISITESREDNTRNAASSRARSHARYDEEHRLMWHMLVPKGDVHVTSTDDPANGIMADNGVPFMFDRTPMPQWARRIISKDRDRMRRVHGSVQRLLERPNGPRHQRVLFRVYGPVQRHPVYYGRVGSELAPLVEYCDAIASKISPSVTATEAGEQVLNKSTSEIVVRAIKNQADAMLVEASKAYAECDQERRQERIADRRRKFALILGGRAA